MSDLIDDIKSDRDLGTPGPWDNKGEHTADTEFGVFAGAGRSICSTGGYSDGLAGTYFENCCNATRIARVPAMEEALLAAVDVVDELEHIMHMHTLTYDSATDAIIAFRKALEPTQ